ncbi:glutamate--tRNA ligase [Desulfoprunum benzoelyticum]|uniref:Glutamate--tRNA ligase n=1 Tax=Desulfoprunum benzoelyticum TaxID=1506996 RepID=A0A840UVA6_9BACT|nr:glutamate--tRNA ligase [Desulfoprunum benzoelyticum]MBB5348773.1 glutamyl-tRNA synthetase [Desulfoprunum benzoelyticum]MBM9529935.1 glutamate--tRNA ligase [Desulfoprunum benzoelyticum]
MTETRLRFPPSPTGYLHIGGARTALYNWLYAKKTGGKLILRIEDTDAERSTEESIRGIIEGLEWLGITYDEGPYFQTDFTADHVAAAGKLLQAGHAYRCFCTKEELDAKREKALAAKQALGYDRTCRDLTPEQVAEKQAAGLPSVIRFKVPDRQGLLGYDDKVLGRIECDYREVDDFVILRSNGKPLYLLSNVVDDIRDRITHIIRGQDHMTNTIRQVLLYEALDAPLPVFAHIPLTLDTKKAKISKRSHGEIVAVHFYRDHGFIPWAFNNFLVLLGWSPGDDREIFSREELIQAFTLERINKSSAVFNFRRDDPKFFTDPKAIAINEHYLRTMPIAELAPMVRKELEAEGLWDDAWAGDRQAWFFHTIDLIRDRFHTLKDFTSLGRAYFADDFTVEDKPLQKNVLKFPDLTTWLPALADRYAQAVIFDAVETERIAREMAEELEIKPGVLINAMRTVVTGQLAGPSMFEILPVIGRDRVVRRMREISRFFPAP